MKSLYIILLSLTIVSCNNDPRKDLPSTGNYGVTFTEDTILTVQDAIVKLNATPQFEAYVTGQVKEYCKAEGCWLTLENKEGEPLFVEVENKLFVLPHHIEGKTAIIKGKVSQTTNDVGKKEPRIAASGIVIK